MSRLWYGGKIEDFAASVVGGGYYAIPGAGVTGTVWSAKSGGTQVTDLLDASNSPISVVSQVNGWVQPFQCPDSAGAQSAYYGAALWVDFGTGSRVEMAPQYNQLQTLLAATFGSLVMHGSTAGTSRPTTSLSVKWVGTVTPTNAVNGDTYLNTATGVYQVMVSGAFVTQNSTAYVAFPPGSVADYAVATRKTGATNGFQWTTKEEMVARALGWIIVTDARWGGGAKFDGSTDDGPAFRAAVAQALTSTVPTVIWMPPGQSVICSTQRTTATGTDASDGHAIAISGSNGGITFKGSGKYATQLLHRGYGNVDPTTNWQNVGGNVWRGAGFWIDTNTPNIEFESFDLDGRTHKTGVTTFPANISTGDGWDITHRAIWFKASGTGWGISRVKDCRLHGYRGEIVLSNGDDVSTLEVRDCELWDSNAGTVSASRTLIIEDNYMHDAVYGIETTYRYYQSYARNRIESMTLDGIVALPFSSGSTYGPCVIRNNEIKLCDRYALGMSNGARNMTVEDNVAIDCGTTSSTWPYLFQTATGLPISNLVVRRNRYLGVTRNQPSSNGSFRVYDPGNVGVSRLVFEDNTTERTAEAIANGFTVNQGFSFVMQASDLSNARIRNNKAIGTTFCYTDQDQCIETLLTATGWTVVAKRRPDRLAQFMVSATARIVTATTTLSMYVSWYDAAGTNCSYYFVNSVSEPVGSVATAPITFSANGPNDITVNANAGTANQVYVTAKITELC